MANKSITDYDPIVTYADDDLIEVVDVSEVSPEDQNKKMTKSVLFSQATEIAGLKINKLAGITITGSGTNTFDVTITAGFLFTIFIHLGSRNGGVNTGYILAHAQGLEGTAETVVTISNSGLTIAVTNPSSTVIRFTLTDTSGLENKVYGFVAYTDIAAF